MKRFLLPLIVLVAVTGFLFGGSIGATFFSAPNFQITNKSLKTEPHNTSSQSAFQENNVQCEHRAFAERLLCDPAAYFTEWLVYVTGGLVIVTGILAVYTANLYKATVQLGDDARKSGETQTKITRQMFLAENRPWISVKPSIVSDLTYDDQNNARIKISFLVTNIGKGPAIGICVEAMFYVTLDDERTLLRKFVDTHRSMRRDQDYGFNLFPSEYLTYVYDLPIGKQEMEAHWLYLAEQAKIETTTYSAYLVGCVIYKFTFEDTIHQTGFVLDLNKCDPQYPHLNMMIDTKDGSIPANLLKLSYSRFSMPPD